MTGAAAKEAVAWAGGTAVLTAMVAATATEAAVTVTRVAEPVAAI